MNLRIYIATISLVLSFNGLAEVAFTLGASTPCQFATRLIDIGEDEQCVVHKGGTLAEDEIWPADKIHVVYGTLIIPAKTTLSIEPDARVKFVGGGIVACGKCESLGVHFSDIGPEPVPSYDLVGDISMDATTTVECCFGRGLPMMASLSQCMRFDTRDVLGQIGGDSIVHDGGIMQTNETWSADSEHVIYGTYIVPGGKTLLIEKGAVVRFVGGGIWALGECVAQGVLFTDAGTMAVPSYSLVGNVTIDAETRVEGAFSLDASYAKANSDCLYFNNTTNGLRLAHQDEQIAFSTDWDASSSVDVTVTDPSGETTVLTNGSHLCEGMLTWNASGTSGEYVFHHITDNANLTARFVVLGDECVVHGGIVQRDVWTADKIHVVDVFVRVPNGGSLEIEDGAVVKFLDDTGISVERGGHCLAKGVIFTHVNDDTVGGDTLFDGGATVPIQNAYVVDGVEDDETTEYRYSAPVVTGGTISQNTSWWSHNVYRITGNLTIASGVTLTIMPGVIVKFDDDMSLTVAAGGTLNAISTRAQPIVFTSIKDDAVGGDTNGDGNSSTCDLGDWGGVLVDGGRINAAYVTFAHGGGRKLTSTGVQGNVVMWGNSSGEFNGCQFLHSPMDGCFAEGAELFNCVFADCDRGLTSYGHPITACNCVAYGNRIGYFSHTATFKIYNSISAFNAVAGYSGDNSYVYAYNCCVFNPEGVNSLSNAILSECVTRDPGFNDAASYDFRLKLESPCVDAGNDTFAPATDYYNQPRNGQADIGIFELQHRPVKADIDLSLVSVTADASATVGGTLTVSWTVENVGSANATGSWRDTFELIDADGATVKLGSYTVSGGIVAGGKRVFTTSFRVPAAAVGAAHLRVKVNPERDIFEGSATGNNVALADGAIDIALAAYSAGEHVALSIGAGSSMALMLPADSGVTALIIRGGSGISAYGAFGYLPKALRNDVMAVRLEDGSLLLSLPPSSDAVDFTFVIANGGYGEEAVTIEPVTESLQVTEVTPNRLANTGDGYITIRGVALDRVAQLRLVGGATYSAISIAAALSSELTVSFPLANAETGAYALEVEDADGEAYRLDYAVEIYKPKVGPKLEAHLEIPSSVRQGRIYTGKIVYSNVGDEDMCAPWLLLKMSGAKIVIDGEELDGSDFEIVGISASYPYGMLKAGETAGLSFAFRCNAPLDFSINAEECRPEANMAKCIADIATRVNMRGRPVYLLGDLMRQLESASVVPDRYALSGVLLEEVDGSPLEGIELGIYDLNGECICADTVDASGRFVLDGLVAGEKYVVKILTEGISGTLSVPNGSGGDVNDLVWYATRGFPVALTFSHLDEPLEKVNLYAVSLTERSYGTPTNITLNVSPNGRVETRVPFAGTYLMVARDGTGLEAASMANVSSFDMATVVEFDFSSGSKVMGRICDQDNMPIAAADVVIKNIENGSSIVALSDESGDYRVGVLPSGEYEINVSADGYCRQVGKIVSVNGKDDYSGFDFSLQAMRNELNGSVKYQDAKGWLVEFTDATYSVSRRTWVDEFGCFSFKGLPEGKGVLRLYDNKGLLRWVKQDLSIDGTAKSVTVEKNQLCYMVCRAYSEDGTFVPATWIWTSGTGDWQMSCSDDDGESIVAVPNGEYRVTVNADGYVNGVLYKNANGSKVVSITLRKAGYCRFLLPKDVDVGKLDLVTFNLTGLHYGGSSVTESGIVSTSLEPGEAQMFVVQGDRAFYSEPSIVESGITNDVCKLDGKPLKIDLSEQNWRRAAKVNIMHEDGSGIVLSREVASRFVAFSEYPDVALKIEFRGVHDELLASAERPSGSGDVVQLFPCDTLNVTGELLGATQGQLLGAVVAFTSIDGRKLMTVPIALDGGFVATSVPVSFANLWFSLSDGTSFSVSRAEAASAGNVCVVPDALGSCVIGVENKSGNAIIGMPFVIKDKEGNSTVQSTDSRGHLSVRRKPGELVVTPCDKSLQIDPIVVNVPSFVCPICRKVPCTCPFETEVWVCEKCGKNPCVCEPEKIEVKETDEDKEEDIPQYELPKIQVKYGGTLIDDINLHDWDFWNPSECWATDLETGLDRYIDEYLKIHKSPPPYVQVCEERKCTYNKRVYDRYLMARQRFLEGWNRIRIAIDRALARSRQCRRLLRNSAAGELGSAYASYMLGPRLKASEGACRGEIAYFAGLRSTLSSGPSGYAAYVNAREEGVANPNANMNREGGKSILWNLGGEAGEALVEYSENVAVKGGGGAIAVGCGPVASTVSMWNENWSYKDEMNNRISSISAMFTYLDALLQYLIGAANTPYHECQRTYSPYEKPYALYILPLETYEVPTVTSCDPNEMGGIMGRGDEGTQRYVKPGEWMTYTVYFENKSDATAAAQEVKVTNPLSPYLDWSTFEMGEVAFNNQIDLGLSGKQNGTSEVMMNGTSYLVRSKVTLDKTEGKVDWYLRIVDPSTPTTWPDDVFAGFLPPNDATYRGEGHLTYRIKVRDDAPAGVKVTNAASIIFDYNVPIETDPAWWNQVAKVMSVEGADGKSINVAVDPAWIKTHVGESATDAEVAAALNATGANGLKVWTSVALGLDPENPDDKFLVDVPQNADENSVAIKALGGELPTNAWMAIQYRLDRDATGGGETSSGTAQSGQGFSIDIGGAADPTGIYQVKAVLSDDDGTSATEVPAANQIGILRKTAANKREIVPVPWTKFAAGAEDIAVSNLVKTAGLAAGDKLYVYDDSAKRYATWELQSDKTWKPVKTVKMVNGKLEVQTADSPEVATVKRGSGVWLERHDIAKPIHFVGQHDVAPVEVTVEAGTTAMPKWNLVASPLLTDWDLNSVSEGVNVADRIIVPTGKEPRIYTRDATNAKWGYIAYEANAKGIVKPVRKEDDTLLKSGTGFWYVSEGGAPTLRWCEASEE